MRDVPQGCALPALRQDVGVKDESEVARLLADLAHNRAGLPKASPCCTCAPPAQHSEVNGLVLVHAEPIGAELGAHGVGHTSELARDVARVLRCGRLRDVVDEHRQRQIDRSKSQDLRRVQRGVRRAEPSAPCVQTITIATKEQRGLEGEARREAANLREQGLLVAMKVCDGEPAEAAVVA